MREYYLRRQNQPNLSGKTIWIKLQSRALMYLQRLPTKPVCLGTLTESWIWPKNLRVKIKRILQTFSSWLHHRVSTTSSPKWNSTKASSLSHLQPWFFLRCLKIRTFQLPTKMLTRRCNSGKTSNPKARIGRSSSQRRQAPYWHLCLRSLTRLVNWL
jgi:hypothetical protein